MPVKRRTSKPATPGANAGGGAIEQGQSKSARQRAGTRPPGGEQSLDETERDTPERQKIRSTIAPAPGKARK